MGTPADVLTRSAWTLKASDYVKVFLVAMIVIGTVAATMGSDFFVRLFTIAT